MKIYIEHRGSKVKVTDDGGKTSSSSNFTTLRYSDQARVFREIISSIISDINKSFKQ